jgi:hypothetical protein
MAEWVRSGVFASTFNMSSRRPNARPLADWPDDKIARSDFEHRVITLAWSVDGPNGAEAMDGRSNALPGGSA